jgi:hypothetical protein
MAASTAGPIGPSNGTPPQQAAESTLGPSQATSSGEGLPTDYVPVVVGAALLLGVPVLAQGTHTTEPVTVPLCRT